MGYKPSIQPRADVAIVKFGSWLFIEIAAGTNGPAGRRRAQIRLYAARLPALNAARQVFAALVFPVNASFRPSLCRNAMTCAGIWPSSSPQYRWRIEPSLFEPDSFGTK